MQLDEPAGREADRQAAVAGGMADAGREHLLDAAHLHEITAKRAGEVRRGNHAASADVEASGVKASGSKASMPSMTRDEKARAFAASVNSSTGRYVGRPRPSRTISPSLSATFCGSEYLGVAC